MKAFNRGRTGRTLLLLSLLFLALLMPKASYSSDTAVMKVFLNTVDMGEYFMVLDAGGRVLFKPDDLREIGITRHSVRKTEVIDGQRYLPLDSIPGLKYEIDDTEAAVRITAEAQILTRQVFDLAYRNPYDIENVRRNSVFLNYSVTYNGDANHDFTSLNVPWELGVNLAGYFGFTGFSYTKSDYTDSLVRLMSNITRDSPSRTRRYILGDYFAGATQLGGGGVYGGFSVSKNYSINPYMITTPSMDFSGAVTTPSSVELYVNDYLVKSEQVSPGEFEIKNFSLLSGSGDSVIVIKDAFGRETRVEKPFYLSTSLLRPGLHDYSYGIGFRRKSFGAKSNSYGEPGLIGYHRYGFSRSLTAGLSAEGDRDTANVGAEARFVLWRLGEFNTAAAASTDTGSFGYAGLLGYLFSSGGFNMRFTAKHRSRDYATLSIGADSDKARLQWSAGMGISNRLLGSLSVSYTDTDMYLATDYKMTTAFYSKVLYRNLILNLTATRTKMTGVVDDVYASLNYFFGGRNTGTLSYNVQDGRTTQSARLQRSTTLGPGLGYNLLAERREDFAGNKDFGGDVFVNYRGTYGTYYADYRRLFGIDTYSINASGALILVGRSVYPTRPVYDSFAVVDVEDIKGVDVRYNNQKIGRTNRWGQVVVPDMISYYNNTISIDDRNLPLNYEIPVTERHVSTPYRGGGIVRFNVKKLQSFTGRLFVTRGKVKRAADYAALKIYTRDGAVDAMVGEGGEFYVENISPGKYRSLLILNQFQCNIDIAIPDSDDMMVDIGDFGCEVE